MLRYEASTPSADSNELALRTYLIEEVTTICAARQLPHPEFVREIAASVTDVCRRDMAGGPVPDRFLSLLMSHGLWSSGDEETARALLNSHCLARSGGDEVLTSLFSVGQPKLNLCLLIALGYVRPVTSSMFGDRPVWILDLLQVADAASSTFELGLFTQLQNLMSHLASVWDATSGSGALGIIGATHVSDNMAEVMAYARDLLRHIAARRKWAAVPVVQNRELSGR